ncbi:hypothetical protein [Methylorubrum aminovorans]
MFGLPPLRPVQPGELDQILKELAERGIEPNRLRVLRRAVERGCPSDLAAAVADAFDQRQQETQAIEESR